MFDFRGRRQVRQARHQYEVARLGRLLANNRRELERLRAMRNAPCPLCHAMESPEPRQACVDQAAR